MNVGTLLYHQYTHLVTDDLKIGTENFICTRVPTGVATGVSARVAAHVATPTVWAIQVAPRMSVGTLTGTRSSRCNKDDIKFDDYENLWF
jgi:hypothetical protein